MTKKSSSEFLAGWLTIFIGRRERIFPERAAFGVAAPGSTCARYAMHCITVIDWLTGCKLVN